MASCAAPAPPPIVLQPPPTPPASADGRYRGTARLVRGDRFCPRSGPRVYEVVNGLVELAYSNGGRSRIPLAAVIQPSGQLQTTDGVGTMEGQLTDGLLEVTISSQQCEHHWTLHKVP